MYVVWGAAPDGGFTSQNHIAEGDYLALPMGELSPKVTERVNTLSGLVNSATSPKGRGKASFENAG